ncbi:hypothetical protein [Streptomyces mirabilis]|uniref:hypothetical protein n=1 Tax=Streptomyces mirabilis TaxID=68239 RepID=UPI0036D0DC44
MDHIVDGGQDRLVPQGGDVHRHSGGGLAAGALLGGVGGGLLRFGVGLVHRQFLALLLAVRCLLALSAAALLLVGGVRVGEPSLPA